MLELHTRQGEPDAWRRSFKRVIDFTLFRPPCGRVPQFSQVGPNISASFRNPSGRHLHCAGEVLAEGPQKQEVVMRLEAIAVGQVPAQSPFRQHVGEERVDARAWVAAHVRPGVALGVKHAQTQNAPVFIRQVRWVELKARPAAAPFAPQQPDLDAVQEDP